MMLACLFGMIRGVNLMALRHVRVMAGFLVIAGGVMLRGRLVMLSGMLVVFGGFAVMFRGLL
jgi:hypothetical protein